MARQSVWERLAIDQLREIDIKRKSLQNVKDRLTTIRYEIVDAKNSLPSLAPAVGGVLNREETRRTDNIALQKELRRSYQQLKNDIDSFEKAWEKLDQDEQLVLSKFFISRTRSYIDELCNQLFCEKTKVYQIKDEALYKFTMGLYGKY